MKYGQIWSHKLCMYVTKVPLGQYPLYNPFSYHYCYEYGIYVMDGLCKCDTTRPQPCHLGIAARKTHSLGAIYHAHTVAPSSNTLGMSKTGCSQNSILSSRCKIQRSTCNCIWISRCIFHLDPNLDLNACPSMFLHLSICETIIFIQVNSFFINLDTI